jgi:hypothetical protein
MMLIDFFFILTLFRVIDKIFNIFRIFNETLQNKINYLVLLHSGRSI